jgi:hypothetical protein
MATRTRRDAGTYVNELVKSAGLDALASVWLFISAFLLHGGHTSFFINNLTCGATAAVLAFGAFAHVWFAWLPAAIGAWVIVSPFALRFTDNPSGLVNNVITGAAILALAIRAWVVSKSARDVGVMGD